MKNLFENKMDRMTDVMANRAAAAVLAARRGVNGFLKEEDGETNLVAILLIIIVTVALVAIFKTRLTALVDKLFTVIEKSTSGI
jgi:Flp pilus assembly pilin Flp